MDPRDGFHTVLGAIVGAVVCWIGIWALIEASGHPQTKTPSPPEAPVTRPVLAPEELCTAYNDRGMPMVKAGCGAAIFTPKTLYTQLGNDCAVRISNGTSAYIDFNFIGRSCEQIHSLGLLP